MIEFKEIALDDGSLECAHCCTLSDPTRRGADDIRASIAEAVESWSGGLGPNIAFTGSDPLAHPDLLDLTRTAISHGVERVRVDTGEGAIGSAERATELIEAGVRSIRVALFGHIESSHDEKTGTDGHYAETTSGTKAFKDAARVAGVHVAVSGIIPLCRHNIAELSSIVARLAEFGATRGLIRLVDGDLDLAAIGPWLVAAFDTGTVNRVWIEAEGIPFFVAPGHEIHLSNMVREFPGVKAPVCEGCEAAPWCDGVTTNASPAMLAGLVRTHDHKALAERLRRARRGVLS